VQPQREIEQENATGRQDPRWSRSWPAATHGPRSPHTRWWKTRPPDPQRDQGLEMYLDDVIPEPDYRIRHSRVIRTPATVVRYIIEAGTSSRRRRRCVSRGGRIRGGVHGVSSSRRTGSPRKFGSQRALDEPEARLGHHDEHGNPGDITE
jgi:hypothetical protein